jgi:CopA family copper-resistance protein
LDSKMTRRDFLKTAVKGAFVTTIGATLPLPAWSQSGTPRANLERTGPKSRYDLEIGYQPMTLNGRTEPIQATAINGTVPGPLVHLREGDRVQLNVTNNLLDSEHTSIHWHGILVPPEMDGVPGVSFKGIPPGDTYHYEYEVKQAGTYWYHSHSAFQEQTGTYGPLVIDPADGEPFDYDRDYAVVLSDWASDEPGDVFRNLKLGEHYYNFQQQTVWDFLEDVENDGFKRTAAERMAWGDMRMSPVDLADVTGAEYTYLMNGNAPDDNWTGLFEPGETVRLRFINASAMSTFDVRLPGLEVEVVMVDGKAVDPVPVEEFRVSVAETYDVLVHPKGDRPYTIFAESLDRSGYARGTLATKEGQSAPVPDQRERPVRTLEDIGMGNMRNMYFNVDGESMEGMDHGGHDMGSMGDDPDVPGPNGPTPFMPDRGVNVAMVNHNPRMRMDDPGIGLGEDGRRVLTYDDLSSAEPQQYKADVDREMTINLTGNMERFIFSFDGRTFSQHPGPYLMRHNERLRLWLVNHTMMEHPIHLHGMWMQIENGRPPDDLPYKHTVLVKPGEMLPVLITPIEKGDWAFHCHLLYHMDAGMFQVVRVS